MIRLLITGLLLIYKMCVTVQAQCNVESAEGYYWRDFRGKIPRDAFPGGRSVSGEPIYIGQVLDPKYRLLIPAKIYASDPRAYYEYAAEEFNVVDNVKIFCTQHPEQLEWIRTSNDDIKLVTDRDIIIGGFEPNCTTYIGRVRYGGEVLVGKALADNPLNTGFYTTNDGKSVKFSNFQVLTYNPKVEPSSNGTSIPSCSTRKYYWRDYRGKIPRDALPGGRSVSGQPIYIGQVLDPKNRFLIPAKIYSGDSRAYYEYAAEELNVTANVKILCTQHPEQLEWTPTNNDDINLITDRDLVIGGYEPKSTTYIGRVRHGGEVLVGKALADSRLNIGFYTTSKGISVKFTSFEVLTDNPNMDISL